MACAWGSGFAPAHLLPLTPATYGSKSTGIGAPRGLDAMASGLATQRAAANAASASEAEKSQDAHEMITHAYMDLNVIHVRGN